MRKVAPVYTPEIAAKICLHVQDGKTMRQIGKMKDMPSGVLLFRWLTVHEDYRLMYEKAMAARSQRFADEMVAIADGKLKANGRPFNDEKKNVQRDRLRIDTRKWLLTKLQPKKYGEKVIQELTGAGGGPIQTEPNDIDTARRLAYLLTTAKGEDKDKD